jgi:hypothetical protein
MQWHVVDLDSTLPQVHRALLYYVTGCDNPPCNESQSDTKSAHDARSETMKIAVARQ